MPSTYTVKITFDHAKNLPVADIGTLSCDPFVLASISTPEHLDLEPLTYRSPTIRRTRDPTWNASWIVAGVPSTGFKLSMVLYDEDPGAKISPDRLGKATARFGPEQMKEGFESLATEYTLKKRKGDLHPYILTYLTALLPGQKLAKHNRVVVSMRVLRKERERAPPGMYTLGPNRYSRHFSPLIGSMVNKPVRHQDAGDSGQTDGKGRRLSATTFIANKLQLTGPVPQELRHRYVGYRPFIGWMFTDKGIRGHLLHYSLRKQYRTIYACDKRTVWGVVEGGVNRSNVTKESEKDEEAALGLEGATEESTDVFARQFLDMAAWGEGGKLFTYVITLDGEWRFTETGPEFAIDLLSKHSMHANLAKEITYSGEFFVQKLKEPQENGNTSATQQNGNIPGQVDGCAASTSSRHVVQPSTEAGRDDRNPKDYELVIDNDSGTYRPKKELLPVLQEWLADARRLGGLGRVRAMDGFDDDLKKMKDERKKAERTKKSKPDKMVQVRRDSDGAQSISSGEIERDSVSGERVDEALKELEDLT